MSVEFKNSGNEIIDGRLYRIISRYQATNQNDEGCESVGDLLKEVKDFRAFIGYNKATEIYESVYHWSNMLDEIERELVSRLPSE